MMHGYPNRAPALGCFRDALARLIGDAANAEDFCQGMNAVGCLPACSLYIVG